MSPHNGLANIIAELALHSTLCGDDSSKARIFGPYGTGQSSEEESSIAFTVDSITWYKLNFYFGFQI